MLKCFYVLFFVREKFHFLNKNYDITLNIYALIYNPAILFDNYVSIFSLYVL